VTKLIKYILILYFSFYFSVLILIFFIPVLDANSVIIPFALSTFDIVQKFPEFWYNFKIFYTIFCLISMLILTNYLFSFLSFLFNSFICNKKSNKNLESTIDFSDSHVFIGYNLSNKPVFIPILGLYQNVLVTGSIGSGKTSSLLYPFTKQLLSFSFNSSHKSAFLILDVKGNYYRYVKKICFEKNKLNDLFIISLNGNVTYNPLDKPNLKPHILANRLKNILLLFSPKQTEAFWLDKAEQILTEAIRLCRLYNDNYVTFIEIHKIIMSKDYYQSKVELLQEKFYANLLSPDEIADFSFCLTFFEDEFFSLDDRTQSILKSEISRITNSFVSDSDICRVFCPDKKNISFPGFSYILKYHKIVVLDMNLSEYSSLAKIIAAYLKLDFQSEILSQLSKNDTIFPSCFICDEYQEYVTSNDATFLAQSRESKSINILATQSYSSLLAALSDSTLTKVLLQNLVNKFWFRTDDNFTIDEIIKQLGKEEKSVLTKSISENAQKTNYNFMFNSFSSKDSNLSESISTAYQKDFIFDSNFFSCQLETFSCLAFISNGCSILPAQKLFLTPYFKERT